MGEQRYHTAEAGNEEHADSSACLTTDVAAPLRQCIEEPETLQPLAQHCWTWLATYTSDANPRR